MSSSTIPTTDSVCLPMSALVALALFILKLLGFPTYVLKLLGFGVLGPVAGEFLTSPSLPGPCTARSDDEEARSRHGGSRLTAATFPQDPSSRTCNVWA